MDIYCKFCGEPWENDCLHDVYDGDTKVSYQESAKRFVKYGCNALLVPSEASECTAAVVDQDAADMSSVLQEISDHPDEWMI